MSSLLSLDIMGLYKKLGYQYIYIGEGLAELMSTANGEADDV